MDNFTAGTTLALPLMTTGGPKTLEKGQDDMGQIDETVTYTAGELEDLRKSNYFLINNGNITNGNPIMKNIEPKVEDAKDMKKREKLGEAGATQAAAAGANSGAKKSPGKRAGK